MLNKILISKTIIFSKSKNFYLSLDLKDLIKEHL